MARRWRINGKADVSDEGVVTAEDHGRRGSHHSEERRVLGALLGRHSRSFLWAIQLQGGLSSFWGEGLVYPTVSFGQVKIPRGGNNVAVSGSTGAEEENGETEKVT